MTAPVQIQFHGLDSSDAVEARVRARAKKLARIHARITECRVVLEAPHRRRQKGRLYVARIQVTMPGGTVAINQASNDKHAHEDIYVAIRDAFDAAERQVREFVRRHDGQDKARGPESDQA